MNSLAFSQEPGCEGVAVSPSRAGQLFGRAIDEGNDTVAMKNLAFWLRSGKEGCSES